MAVLLYLLLQLLLLLARDGDSASPPPITIERIFPTSGASDASTPLSVFARSLPPHEPLECVFDNSATAAAVRVTPTLVICAAPPSQRRETRLRLATRSHGLLSDPVIFTYEEPGALAALVPAVGEVAGGVAVTIRANRFRADTSLLCFFGVVPVDAVERVNATAARVVVPAATDGPGTVDVRCLEDGVAIASLGLTFTYVPGVRVSWFVPQTGFASAATGVVVHGSGFQRDFPMQCRFGDALVSAQFVAEDQVRCTAPPSSAGAARFAVHLDAVRTVRGPIQHVFEYLGGWRVTPRSRWLACTKRISSSDSVRSLGAACSRCVVGCGAL